MRCGRIKTASGRRSADIEGLTAVITEAKAIKNEGFTKESWDALQNKIAEAEELASAEMQMRMMWKS